MTNSKKRKQKFDRGFPNFKQISNRNKLKPDKISAVFPALPSTQNDRYQCFTRSNVEKRCDVKHDVKLL